MSKFWCQYPFTHVSIDAGGYYQTCCEGEGDGSSVQDGYTPEDWINSEFMKRVRDGFLSENPTDVREVAWGCKNCIKKEKLHGASKRTRDAKHNRRWAENQLPELEIYHNNIERHKQGLPIEKVIDFNIAGFGNHCNISCVMCDGRSSDKWSNWLDTYGKEQGWETFRDLSLNKTYLNSNVLTDEIFDDFVNSFESLISPDIRTRIYLAGGEPLLQKNLLRFFDEIGKRGHDLKIGITTNGTVPVKVLEKNFGHYKNLTISISLDGIGKKAEFIRAGTDWERYEENVFEYHALVSRTPGWDLHSFTTFQALNAGDIDDIAKWTVENNFFTERKPGHLRYHTLIHPNYLGVSVLPEKIRMMYLERLENSKYVDQSNMHIAKETLRQWDDYEFQKFIHYLDLCDLKNGTDWKSLWPEFLEYI